MQLPISKTSGRGRVIETTGLLRLLLFSSIYIVTALSLHALQTDSWRLSIGLAVGLLLAFGFRYIWVVIAGQALIAGWVAAGDATLPEALVAAATVTGSYVLASIIVRLAFPEKEIDLTISRNIWTFLLVTPVAAGIGSLVTVSYKWAIGLVQVTNLWNAALSEVASASMGIILLTPAFMLMCVPCIERLLAKLAGEQKLAESKESPWEWQIGLAL